MFRTAQIVKLYDTIEKGEEREGGSGKETIQQAVVKFFSGEKIPVTAIKKQVLD